MGKKLYKKSSPLAQAINQLRHPAETRIPPATCHINVEAFDGIRRLLSSGISSQPKNSEKVQSPQLLELLKLLPELATGIWRARQKMLIPGKTDEPREEMRRIFRPLDATFQNMIQAGIEVVDHTNQPYVTGLREKVIAFEPTRGIHRDTVIETIKPTVLFQEELLQLGEIIVGTPTHVLPQTSTPIEQENS
jgi:hypothetical protein